MWPKLPRKTVEQRILETYTWLLVPDQRTHDANPSRDPTATVNWLLEVDHSSTIRLCPGFLENT